MFDIQEYYKAETVASAVKLLTEHQDARLIAGGTDVLVKLRHMDEGFRQLVDIHETPELKNCVLENDGFLRIGAGLTFTETMKHPLVQEHLSVLGEAAGTVAGPQIRNMGTIGGNIANGAVSADTAAPMMILEPELEITGPDGTRRVSVLGFHTGPGKVALAHNEVLTAFWFKPEKYRRLGACYYKYAMRSAMDIATIGCAAGVRLDGDKIVDLRLALTVAAPTPIRCQAAEAAGLGRPLNQETLAAILAALDGDIKPRTSWRATKEFRVRIIKTLVERMTILAAERFKGKVN